MTPQDIKEQMIRLESFADGIKNGAAMLAQWIAQQLDAEKKKEEQKKDK